MPTSAPFSTRGTRSRRSTATRRSHRLTAAVVAYALIGILSAPSAALAEYVFVDPGHGGRYPGAVYGGVSEKYVNLLVALEVRTALIAEGHTVSMTRTGDYTVGTGSRRAWHWDDDGVHYRFCIPSDDHDAPITDLQARVDMANAAGADLFISIHNNAAGSSARGTETYHNWDNATDVDLSGRLARYVQDEVTSAAGTRDRGTHGVGFYVVRWSNMPAVLVEVGFLSNSSDRALLLTRSFRRQVARGVATGVRRFLASDPFRPIYPRIAGGNRYATAAAIARSGWPAGSDTVFLASAEQWPDSLAATSLAARLDAPILLVGPDTLRAETAELLAEWAPSDVVILGGAEAVSSRVETAVAGYVEGSGTVRRIAGTDRYETAGLIAEEIGAPGSREVFVVSGTAFPDALSAASRAGSRGSPILMTPGDVLDDATRDYLTAHASEIDRVYVIGGEPAVGPNAVVAVSAAAAAPVTRVSGPNRYETNLAVLDAFWPSGDISPYVAKATDFPDALVSGVLAARDGEPILLVGTKVLPARTRESLIDDADRVQGFTVIGDENAVSGLMEWQLQKALPF